MARLKMRNIPFEALIWIAALTALAFSNPLEDPHYTICPLALSGIEWCPGCGLGRSISALFHGEFKLSWEYHWLGIPAVLIIVYRIKSLLQKSIRHFGCFRKHNESGS